MEELLQKLLEAEVLSEDTKKELEGAFQKKLDEAITAAKEVAADDVRAELSEQWVTERDQLIEAVDSKVTEFLVKEVEELKNDIESFRDLETEYAEKLVEAKAAMSDELKDDLMELVEKVDAFLEIRLSAEVDELREDIDNVRKNDFGRRIVEAFAEEFMLNFVDEEAAQNTLREITERLHDTEEALAESESRRSEIERTVKMEDVLSPLGGRQREVMEAILRNVDTEHLEEGYKTFIGRVIRETDDSEKEGSVLAENCDDDNDMDDKKSKKSKKKSDKDDDDKDEKTNEGVVVTGDKNEVIMEDVDPVLADHLARIRQIAGIN